MRWRKVIGVVVGTGALCIVAIALWLQSLAGSGSGTLRMTALDVGQGDAILLQTPHGQDVLVDGGPWNGRVAKALERHLPRSDRDLELVVLTHPDADHVGGLPEVAQRYRIDRVLETGLRATSSADRQWVEAVRKQGSVVTTARAGTAFMLDGVRLDVLWPESDRDLETKNRNDTSVVLRVTYGTTSLLLSGDITSVVEERLVLDGTALPADVLKAPHHGSAASSSDAFLDAVAPVLAVISVGQGNYYGHPHAPALRRYQRRGIRVLRTDEKGDVVVRSDGTKITFDN